MLKKPKPVYRFLKFIINLLSIVLIALLLDGLVVSPIAKTTNIYKTHNEEYSALKVEYRNFQDLYGLYTYDSEGNRKKVEGADTTAFNNDFRVKEIVELAKKDEMVLAKINFVTFVISYVISSFSIGVLVPVFSKKHNDVGGLIFHIVLTKNGEIMTRKKGTCYALVNTSIHFLLGTASLFVIDLIDFLFVIFSRKEQKSLLERIFKYEYSIDPDLVESEIKSEEKKFEEEHSYDDQTPRNLI